MNNALCNGNQGVAANEHVSTITAQTKPVTLTDDEKLALLYFITSVSDALIVVSSIPGQKVL